MKKLFMLFSLLCFLGCSHMAINVASTPPQADVVLVTRGGSQILGKTPLTITNSQLASTDNGVVLEISKEGHFQQRIVIEKRSVSSTGDISVNLPAHPKFDFKKNDPDVKATIAQIARNVSSIQAFLVKREYAQAESVTKVLLNEYPNLAVGWSLLGNNYYLQGRYDEAASHYSKALEIEPDNQETRDILIKMNRAPASNKDR